MKYSTLKTGAAALFAATVLASSNRVAAQTRPAPAPAATPAPVFRVEYFIFYLRG